MTDGAIESYNDQLSDVLARIDHDYSMDSKVNVIKL